MFNFILKYNCKFIQLYSIKLTAISLNQLNHTSTNDVCCKDDKTFFVEYEEDYDV